MTYCDLESFIEIYIHYTICVSTYNIFQFECVYINLPLNLPMSGHRRKFTLLDFRPSYINLILILIFIGFSCVYCYILPGNTVLYPGTGTWYILVHQCTSVNVIN